MQDDGTTMKEKLLETVVQLREQGVDLAETPALFQWVYDEEPTILFQVMVSEKDEGDMESLQ